MNSLGSKKDGLVPTTVTHLSTSGSDPVLQQGAYCADKYSSHPQKGRRDYVHGVGASLAASPSGVGQTGRSAVGIKRVVDTVHSAPASKSFILQDYFIVEQYLLYDSSHKTAIIIARCCLTSGNRLSAVNKVWSCMDCVLEAFKNVNDDHDDTNYFVCNLNYFKVVNHFV